MGELKGEIVSQYFSCDHGCSIFAQHKTKIHAGLYLSRDGKDVRFLYLETIQFN